MQTRRGRFCERSRSASAALCCAADKPVRYCASTRVCSTFCVLHEFGAHIIICGGVCGRRRRRSARQFNLSLHTHTRTHTLQVHLCAAVCVCAHTYSQSVTRARARARSRIRSVQIGAGARRPAAQQQQQRAFNRDSEWEARADSCSGCWLGGGRSAWLGCGEELLVFTHIRQSE